MDSLILAYISDRMTDIGFGSFSFEPLVVVLNDAQKEVVIEGTNEYYYLLSKDLIAGVEIISDNNYFKSEDYYGSLEFGKTVEFTGQIKATCATRKCQQTIVLEFIRVIPQIKQDGK